MRWNKHLRLEGEHAFLSPSNYHWVNYSDSRLADRWFSAQMAALGTAQHEYAKQEIEAGRLSEHTGILGRFINDAIEFGMTPEQVLFYSENCFGTADAISFRRKVLRIHDYKSGDTPTSVKQLEVYEALFCLEYGIDPYDITGLLRIYQYDQVDEWEADPDRIQHIMDKIVHFDQQINHLKREEES